MSNHLINLDGVRIVATALAELNEKVAFVGGATVGLYADDPAAAEPRPTDDINPRRIATVLYHHHPKKHLLLIA